MKPLAKIVAFLVGTAVLGAAVAPWLYWGGLWLSDHAGLRGLGTIGFERYFHRAFLLAALALLWPTARWLQVSHLSEFGLERNPHRWRDLAFGLATSALLLWIYGALLTWNGFCHFKNPPPWGRIPSAFLTAAAVSVLEESLFRGAILGLVSRAASAPFALTSVSALFSILHFLKPREEMIHETVTAWSGFALIPEAFHQFQMPMLILAEFSTLFVLGLLLAIATRATRSLWLAIGLHAGLVLGLRTFSILTTRITRTELPWVGENLKVGLFPLLVLLVLLAAVWAYVRCSRSPAPSPARNS